MRIAPREKISDTYFSLVRAFPLRRLRSRKEHAEAAKIYMRLAGCSSQDFGTRDYLDVLADLIAEYEKRAGLAIETSGLTASELVRHRLGERGMSVAALAREIGVSQPNLSEMLSGKRDWSKSAIRGISAKFNIRAERFLR